MAGTLLSYRRPFHIGDAAYVGPPLLFAFVCAGGLIQLLADREPDLRARRRFRTYSAAVVVFLVGISFAGRALQYLDDERVGVPGTRDMITARPELAERFASLARSIRSEGREGLVVFPEGEILNFLSDRRNPIRHKLYIPGYLTAENEPEILAELERSPPDVVVILYRPTSEYGPSNFGTSYGSRIRDWMDRNYEMRRINPGGNVSRMGSSALLGVRKKPV
jgi:hypothetical protein